MTRKQLAAALALVLGAATLVLAAIAMVREFPRGAFAVACVTLALAAGWYGIRRRGVARYRRVAAAVLLLAVAVVLLDRPGPAAHGVDRRGVRADARRGAVGLPGACRSARGASAAPPGAVLQPRSGGGKAATFDLPEQARRRGIEPIELTPGTDLEVLVREAVADGADALAMAGGDGSQAIVAAIAAEHGLPYACVPAGTRNHFALDLGVDRDDVVGALDAFVDGGERVVDLADVNGRVFVNNVSLGLYAEAVQRHGYRDAKLRTIMDTVPDALGPGGAGLDLHWTGQGGHEHRSGAAILVSNNRYRLGRAVGSGTRPRIDDGLLGITVVGAPRGGDEDGGADAPPLARMDGPGVRGRQRRPPSPRASTVRR